MSRSILQGVVNAVVRRAQSQGYVVAREIRAELAHAALPDTLWKDMVMLAGPALSCRSGRYYYVTAGPDRMRLRVKHDHRNHIEIHKAVCDLLGQKRRSAVMGHQDRRAHKRVDFVRPVQAQAEDGAKHRLLTRNISLSGIRLVGNCALQGQKVHIWFPGANGKKSGCGFLVHILWSSPVDDHLYENGGVFLERLDAQPRLLKIMGR